MMYQLAIDIGNTSIKMGIFEKDKMLFHFSQNQFEPASFKSFLQPYKITKAMIASSGNVPNGLVETLTSLDIQVVSMQDVSQFSFQNNYQSQETLGQDRIALIEGALPEYSLPILIISCGTCITYNYVDETCSFIGGAISPGLHMRTKAMASFTAHLPEITITEPSTSFIGTDTQSCLKIGALHGFLHEINGFITTYKEHNPKISIIITGGDALYLESPLKNKIFVDLFLTLKGLNQILLKHEI